MSFMGILILVGTVVNYAIVMIDYINQLRKKGMERDESIIEGAVIRLRPIVISSLTTVLALFPMALSRGEGSELFSPIAITMLGGLFAGASLSLIIIPTFYSLFDDLAKKMKRKKTYQAVSATDNHFH
jgi:HAE1 family hydrophobic/amphiphilic exporter-1